jgi:transitional endoplasmic reticulum ATPase
MSEVNINALLAEAEKAKKINWDRLDTQIQHEGRSITLPGDPGKMPIPKAIEALQRKQKDEEQIVAVHEVIEGHPFDGLVAFVKAMANLYGWSSPVPTPGFWGPKPPQMISVKTGHRNEDVIQCPHGSFVLPGVENRIQTHMGPYGTRSQPALVIAGEVRKREKHLLLELANEARRIVKEESIYRGKAIRFGVDDHGNVDMGTPPEFMDTSAVTEDSLLFNANIKEQINTNILVPMKQTRRCRELKIPLKRGILLEGPYGTGKSLTAAMTAKVAEDNGWTFILLDKVQGLRAALEFANRYAPAVVFAEDIDRIATVRDEKANDLINTIDGVVSKRSEVMTILTTNFAENLNPVILRPGRLDAVISLKAPDVDTVMRLIRFYAGKLLAESEPLVKSAKELAGQIPASIRECVERAKLGMIGRGDVNLSDLDILTAAETMKNHLALLNKDQKEPSVAEVLASSLKKVVTNGSGESLNFIKDKVEDIHNQVC